MENCDIMLKKKHHSYKRLLCTKNNMNLYIFSIHLTQKNVYIHNRIFQDYFPYINDKNFTRFLYRFSDDTNLYWKYISHQWEETLGTQSNQSLSFYTQKTDVYNNNVYSHDTFRHLKTHVKKISKIIQTMKTKRCGCRRARWP